MGISKFDGSDRWASARRRRCAALLGMVVLVFAAGRVGAQAEESAGGASLDVWVGADVAWDWPERAGDEGDRHEARAWVDPVLAGLRWWLGVELPEAAPSDVEDRGRLVLTRGNVRDGSAWEWSAVNGDAAVGHERAALHRRASRTLGAESITVAECMIDLNAVRRADPRLVGDSSVEALLRTWRLSNSREIMVHVRTEPRPAPLPLVLQLDVTWSSRSQPPERIGAMRLSRELDPIESAALAERGASWVIAMPMNVRQVVAKGLGTAVAARSDRPQFEVDSVRWTVAMRDRITRLGAVLERKAVVYGGGSGVGVEVPLARAGAGRSVASDLDRMQRRARLEQATDGLSGRAVLSEPASVFWTVETDERGSRLRMELRGLEAERAGQ